MEKVIKNNWPTYLENELHYALGERPLHEYLEHHAKDRPEDIAYHYYGNSISWSTLNTYVDKLANFLKNKRIKKGDRVAIYMQNCPQYIISYFSVQKIGAIVVPLNPMYKQAELEYFLNEVSVKAIILTDDLYRRVQSIQDKITTVEIIITTNYQDFAPEHPTLALPNEFTFEKQVFEQTYDLKTEIENNEPLQEAVAVDIWKDVCLMSFTSGTTGRPKAAMLTYGNALFKAASSTTAFGFTKDDRTVVIPPLVHIGGKVIGINIPIYSGCESVLFTRFDAGATLHAIEKYRINYLYTLPPMNVAMMEHSDIKTRDLSSLEINFATSFGIPVTEELAKEWGNVTDGCPLFEATYGLSETHDVDTFMPQSNIKYGSVGIPTFNTNIKIVDIETGEPLTSGEEGEIVIKSPGVFNGYYKRPEDTEETLKDGWLYTGDIGSFDEDGYLYLHGRVKEMIKSSGFSVFPEDVESLLNMHEGILQSAVIGVPDERRGESVKAFVVLKEDYKGKITEEDIIEWARKSMSAYKYPRYVEFRDSLPESISGKVLRRHLQEDLE